MCNLYNVSTNHQAIIEFADFGDAMTPELIEREEQLRERVSHR
ncbi:hypothetical protein [Pseudaminobacter soli (ex Zhang et al. 2022)]|nr:hypothetical protein [Pseudaminobacter soli]